MVLKPETVAALNQLFGRTPDGETVCAADEQAQLLWTTDAASEDLLQRLRSSVFGCDTPVIPRNGEFIIPDYLPATMCTAQAMMQDEEVFFVLRFRQLPTDRPLTVPEFRSLLAANDEVCGGAARRILAALNDVEDRYEESAKSAEIRAACQCILRQQVCGSELLWYEMAERGGASFLPPVNISAIADKFAKQLTKAAFGWFAVFAKELPQDAFSRVDPARLEMALLSIFISGQGGAANRTGCDITLQKTDGFHEITLTFHPFDTPADPLLHRPAPDPTAVSESVLTDRFCSYFGAELIRRNDDGRVVCVLRLPAAAPDGTEPVLCAPEESPFGPHPVFSPYSVLLTRIRSLEKV
ncbi:MAG: hypothetical protein K6E36_10010 [Oscillospiraceae bacterium]|nr:hypothetical protein [Oscillospiraceae bacterium]